MPLVFANCLSLPLSHCDGAAACWRDDGACGSAASASVNLATVSKPQALAASDNHVFTASGSYLYCP